MSSDKEFFWVRSNTKWRLYGKTNDLFNDSGGMLGFCKYDPSFECWVWNQRFLIRNLSYEVISEVEHKLSELNTGVDR